jgi:predicted N-acetyltransferase YhbS
MKIETSDIKRCTQEDLDALIGLLDAEFVFSRGRKISLKSRLPNVFASENLNNIHIIESGGNFYSSVCIRPFNWITTSEVYKGAMIGLVYTHPDVRGKGLATMLMKEIQLDLKNSGMDFGVLWTKIPEFYQQLGWAKKDHGIFGEAEVNVNFNDLKTISARPIQPQDISWMEILRRRWFPHRVGRDVHDYASLPLSAETLEIILQDSGNKDERFYVLSGRTGDSGYIYEVVGKPTSYPVIWHSICNSYRKVYINDSQGSLFENWLNRQVNITWNPQMQAMWYSLHDNIPFDDWYIPYFDRI